MHLQDFISTQHPDILDEYKRFATRNYYETNVLYYTLTNVFGGKADVNRHFRLIECSILKENMFLTFQDVKTKTKYQTSIYDAYKRLARVDANAFPEFNMNITDGTRYLDIGNDNYTIKLMTWLSYDSKRHNSKVWIKRTNDKPIASFNGSYMPYYELYSVIGKGGFDLKHVYGYDSIAREIYNLKRNISVKEAKKIIFGSDIKIPSLPDAKVFKDFDKFFIK